MPNLRLGILPWSQAVGWADLLDVGRRVERLGYEHLWAWDHLFAICGDPAQPIFEGWQTLAAWAIATPRVPLEDSLEPSRPLLGPPEAIAARLREMAKVGFESVVVEMPAPYDIETLERLMGEVKPLVDAA